MSIETLPLFAECALPGCRNPSVDEGGPCTECAAIFDGSEAAGGFAIRRRTDSDGRAETAEEVATRKAEQLAAQVGMAAKARTLLAQESAKRSGEPERKQNQTCWICEERRTCTKLRSGWECDTCRTIT